MTRATALEISVPAARATIPNRWLPSGFQSLVVQKLALSLPNAGQRLPDEEDSDRNEDGEQRDAGATRHVCEHRVATSGCAGDADGRGRPLRPPGGAIPAVGAASVTKSRQWTPSLVAAAVGSGANPVVVACA